MESLVCLLVLIVMYELGVWLFARERTKIDFVGLLPYHLRVFAFKYDVQNTPVKGQIGRRSEMADFLHF